MFSVFQLAYPPEKKYQIWSSNCLLPTHTHTEDRHQFLNKSLRRNVIISFKYFTCTFKYFKYFTALMAIPRISFLRNQHFQGNRETRTSFSRHSWSFGKLCRKLRFTKHAFLRLQFTSMLIKSIWNIILLCLLMLLFMQYHNTDYMIIFICPTHSDGRAPEVASVSLLWSAWNFHCLSPVLRKTM